MLLPTPKNCFLHHFWLQNWQIQNVKLSCSTFWIFLSVGVGFEYSTREFSTHTPSSTNWIKFPWFLHSVLITLFIYISNWPTQKVKNKFQKGAENNFWDAEKNSRKVQKTIVYTKCCIPNSTITKIRNVEQPM